MGFNFQILVNLSIAGLTEFAQEDLAWHYLSRVWLEGIQFLEGEGRRLPRVHHRREGEVQPWRGSSEGDFRRAVPEQ